ncbi:MAG: uroporphyrinogen decarboxylase [Armatimonadota bacterium]|nr:uroporphyrinogen decarboxylase [Armatimonadota bacterium]MDR7454132.1 uroporphyrinogen decarboxylase [Armatimonadota bacterium]MDR7456231.1 uroporphyrinogen decarboxylase [Armatimonadota bacterium]MDR7496901.1 uroporphyrinogen decarboxylase [Armatimonadota bacterium]MDR7512440.1 uroporphyrinogen decarboxylase [Armatimonadota bacterium]
MTDRFLRACRREPTDRTPVWFMRQAGRSQPEYRALRERYSLLEICRTPELCAEVTLRPAAQLGVDAVILFADITLPLLGLGVEFDLIEGQGPVIARPLRTAADVRRLRPLDPARDVPFVLEAIHLVRRDARVPLIGFAGAPFTLASYLVEGRGARDLLLTKRMLFEAPEVWDTLMAHLVDATVAYLRAQVDAGAQALQLFDSWVGALAPDDYARAVLPHMRRLFDGLRALRVPVIHFGTGTAGLLRLMAQAGGDVIGVDWRIRLADAWALVGDRGIQGNLDPAALLAPFEVAARAAHTILTDAAGRPGHIFNLGHGVLPHTPQDHLRRLVALVHEHVPLPAGGAR